MKRLITLVLVCVVLGLVGCTGLTDIVKKFKAENPNATVLPIDDDGVKGTDALGYDTDGDGNVDAEIPGSRAAINDFKQTDAGIADLLTLIGTAIAGFTGIAGFGTAGFLWRKIKPVQRAGVAKQTFGENLVNAIQDVRTNGSLTPEAVKNFNAVLREAQRHYAGLEAAVMAVKDGKEIPTAKT